MIARDPTETGSLPTMGNGAAEFDPHHGEWSYPTMGNDRRECVPTMGTKRPGSGSTMGNTSRISPGSGSIPMRAARHSGAASISIFGSGQAGSRSETLVAVSP